MGNNLVLNVDNASDHMLDSTNCGLYGKVLCKVWIDDGELKTKSQDKRRALVLVVRCVAMPAVQWYDATTRCSMAARPSHFGST